MGESVAKVIEPPVLISRILTFVFATSVVVLITMAVALIKMMPLERPEVFFLSNRTTSVNAVIEPLVPDSTNEKALEMYEKGFVREYIISRNTLSPNMATTIKNWANVVKPWSSNRVYSAFARTALYGEYTSGDTFSGLSCSVNFTDKNKEQPVVKTGHNLKYDEYTVTFAWVCKNSGGQTTQKNYKIRIRIQSVLDEKASNTLENLNKLRDNPLGIRVVEYTILDGDGDPLDSDRHSL